MSHVWIDNDWVPVEKALAAAKAEGAREERERLIGALRDEARWFAWVMAYLRTHKSTKANWTAADFLASLPSEGAASHD